MTQPAWLDQSEYPFNSQYLELGMGKLHYIDEGQGEPIVMVHGNPTWSFLYRHLIKQFSDSHRCIAMDHIGFGLSDKPTNWTYQSEDHAKNLETLIDTLGLQDITLVVQDWGGPIGLSYAINHPSNVRRLIIMNTWLWPVHRDWYYIGFSKFTGGPIGRYLIRRFNFFVNVIMPQAYSNRARLTADIHAHYQHPLARATDRKGCWVFPGQIIDSSPWLKQLWAQRDKLAHKPILIVWGMKDIAFRPKELRTWAEALPNAQVVELPDVGHFVQEEAVAELELAMKGFL